MALTAAGAGYFCLSARGEGDSGRVASGGRKPKVSLSCPSGHITYMHHYHRPTTAQAINTHMIIKVTPPPMIEFRKINEKKKY